MHSDENTLAEDFLTALLRAGFDDTGASTQVIEEGFVHESSRAQVLALRAATRRGLMTTSRWEQSLQASDLDVRREALALYATQEANELLSLYVRESLHHDDALVVDAAVFACGEHLDVLAVDALIEVATSHDDARCRESAVAALGAIGDDRARPAILGALSDKPPVRRRAVVALSNFEGPDVDAALEAALEDRDWQVRAAAGQLSDN
jgi:HEAT repeat protein